MDRVTSDKYPKETSHPEVPKRRWMQAVLALLLFVAGASIYLLFRSRQLLGFRLADAMGMGTTVDAWRDNVSHLHPSEFVLYSLPDGFWTCSYLLLIDLTLRHERPTRRFLWASVIPVLGIGSELLQFMHLCPGTFDPWDLACYTTPLILYYIILKP